MAATLEIRLTGVTNPGSLQTVVNSSSGGYMSGTTLSGVAMNDLWDNVQPDEATAGRSEWRVIDIYNSDPTSTAVDVDLYWSTVTPSPGSRVEIGAHATDGCPHSAGWLGQILTNDITAPNSPSVVTSEYQSGAMYRVCSGTGIPPLNAARVYMKRVITPGAGNYPNDLCTLTIQYA